MLYLFIFYFLFLSYLERFKGEHSLLAGISQVVYVGYNPFV